jgi:hypothetical protein
LSKPKLFLHHLFDIHTADLHAISPKYKGLFVCPICLNPFTRKDIENKRLSDGHVWQEDLRQLGNAAISQHHVLLCTKCNNIAGSRGDKQTGLMEMYRNGEESGNLYGVRTVYLTPIEGENPLKIQVEIKRDQSGMEFEVTGRLKKDRRFVGSSPQDQKRFVEIATQGMRVANLEIHPPGGLNGPLVKAGWFTAAYLFAFYCLGYRYILRKALDPVREYILRSFEVDDDSLQPPEEDNCCLLENYGRFLTDPIMNLIIPLNQKLNYLQVNFLRYQIRLPFPINNPELLFDQLYLKMPDLDDKLPELRATGHEIIFPIEYKGLNQHNIFFDYLLEKLQ